jgi:alpha-glucosidase
LPVQRSLSINYTNDNEIYNPEFDNQYLFGPSLLVIPAKSTAMSINGYFPEGTWYSFYSDKKVAGPEQKLVASPLDKLPVYVKAGAIIPIQKLTENTSENPGDTLEIHVYAGNVNNHFEYYEDDGTTYNYQQGDFYKRKITFNGKDKKMTFEKPEGNDNSRFHYLRIVFHGFTKADRNRLQSNNTTIQPDVSHEKLFLRNYQSEAQDVFSITLPNKSQKIILTW